MTLKTSLIRLLKDSKGILLSTDLMLSMIIITVTLGMTAHALDLVSTPLQDYSMQSDIEKTAIEAADILINTPGSPSNWEELNKTSISPGLAEVNPANGETTSQVISYKKLSQLKSNYDELMKRVFPEYMSSSITLYPINNTLEPINIHEEIGTSNTSQIVVVNRTVMCDYQYLNCTLHINSTNDNYSSFIKQPEICPHKLHNPDSGLINNSKENSKENESGNSKWICKHFYFNTSTLNTTDYYLLVENNVANTNARWILDRSEIIKEQEMSFSSGPLKLNDKISSLIGNEKQTVLWLHVKSNQEAGKSFNIYIVAVPKNTDEKYVNMAYLTPQPCYFILKVWLN